MLLLRPLKNALGNHLRSYATQHKTLLRDLVVLSLIAALGLFIFSGMHWILFKLNSGQGGFRVAPETILAFSINLFLPLVFFSTLSSHFSNFYASEDLELLLASPISKTKFFLERSIITSLESSWMVMVSVTPFLLSFISVYTPSWGIVFALPLSIAILMLIPAFLASIVGLIWNMIVPRIPQSMLMAAIAFGALYLLVEVVSMISAYLSGDSSFSAEVVLGTFRRVGSYGELWSPAVWIATLVSAFLNDPEVVSSGSFVAGATAMQDASRNTAMYTGVIMLSALAMLISLGLLMYDALYMKALSLVWGKTQKSFSFTSEGRLFEKLVSKLYPKGRAFIALLKRETILFCRDSSLMVQVVFLLFMLGAYLYLLRFQQNIQSLLVTNTQIDWKFVIVLANLTVESFLTIAIASRLLFPSLSREGRTIWLLQTSPTTAMQVLLSKFIFWVIPMVIALGTLGGLSYFLTYGREDIAIVKACMMASGAFSVGALAMYLGAVFANFSWESRSQLIASFGSIVFMVSGLALATCNILSSLAILAWYAGAPIAEAGAETSVLNIFSNIYAKKFFIMSAAFVLTNLTLSVFFIRKANKSLIKRMYQGI